MTDDEIPLRDVLTDLAQRLLDLGLVRGTSGNLSARIPGSGRILITPSGVEYETMTPDLIVAVDDAGRSTPHGPKPSSDTPNHLAIYRARPDVNGIVHTHSPYATAFAVLAEPIPPLVLEPAGYLGGGVRVMEYHSPASAQLPAAVARGLASDRALLLPNHGVIAVGEDPEAAFQAARLVEEAARIAWLAGQIGEPRAIPDADLAWMHEFIHRRYGQR